MIGIILVIVPIHCVALWFEMRWIRENKTAVFKALTALPKGVVSSIAEELRSVDSDGTGSTTGNLEEVNKQEDNILKIFLTSGGSSESTNDRVHLIIVSVAQVIMVIVCSVLIWELMSNADIVIRRSAGHLDSVQGSFAYIVASYLSVKILSYMDVEDFSFPADGVIAVPEWTKAFHECIQHCDSNYFYFLYGEEGHKDRIPFPNTVDVLHEANEISR
jgi:hypothetical protein